MSFSIEPNDLVYYTDKENNIYSGGYSIQSILLKQGISPITTINTNTNTNNNEIKGGMNEQGGGGVSDIFKDLVVPNWAIYYPSINSNKHLQGGQNNALIEENGGEMEDTLYNKLLKLVSEDDAPKKNKKTHKKSKEKTNVKKTQKTQKTKK